MMISKIEAHAGLFCHTYKLVNIYIFINTLVCHGNSDIQSVRDDDSGKIVCHVSSRFQWNILQ